MSNALSKFQAEGMTFANMEDLYEPACTDEGPSVSSVCINNPVPCWT